MFSQWFCRHCRELITFATYNGLRTHLRAKHAIYAIEENENNSFRYDPDSPIVQAIQLKSQRRERHQQNQPPAAGYTPRQQSTASTVAAGYVPVEAFGQLMEIVGKSLAEGIERGVVAAIAAMQNANNSRMLPATSGKC